MLKQIKFRLVMADAYPLNYKRPLDPERRGNGKTRHRLGGLRHHHGSL